MNSTDPAAAAPPPWVPSTIVLNPFTQFFVDDRNHQIAPWFAGLFVDLFLQGILVVQAYNYFSFRSPEESTKRFSAVVIVLMILCILKTAQNIGIVWNYGINYYANPDWAALLVAINWLHYSTSLMTAVIAIYVQSFFVYRYWMLTKRVIVCIPVIVGMVMSLIAAILVIYYIPKIVNDTVKMWSTIHFGIAVLVDFAITVGTAHHLYQQKSSVQSTSAIVNRLIRMTWQSALPPAIMITLNLIVLMLHPWSLDHIALNMIAAKLYAISLMYTLNLRNEIRGERMTSHERSLTNGKRSFIPGDTMGGRMTQDNDRSGALSFGLGRGRRNSQIRKMDGIHIETHVATNASSGANAFEMKDYQDDSFKAGVTESHSDIWDNRAKSHAN